MDVLGEQAVHDALTGWLGGWPPDLPVAVVADPEPQAAGWDGGARGVAGVVDPSGRALVRVPPEVAARLGRPADVPALLEALPGAVARPGTAGLGVLRWADGVPGPEQVPDAGVWLPASLADVGDARVPAWLRPFGGQVLVALDDAGAHLAGVGIKRHTPQLSEVAVVTAEAARGRGLARRLVAQAARAELDAGRSVLYLHAPDNTASARVADASGFPSRGWRVLGYWERSP